MLGKFLHFYPYSKIENFEVVAKRLFLFKKKELKVVNLNFTAAKDLSYAIPERITEIGKLFYVNNQLLHVKDEAVDVYQIH